MKLNQYLNNNKAQPLPLEIGGQEIQDVYFRRLNAGEGLELKEAVADLAATAGDTVAKIVDGDSEKSEEEAEEQARKNLSPEQMREMFKYQALFTFLHFGNKDGSRAYESRKEFDKEVPDELIQAFYAAGSALANKSEPDQEKAEKNS